MTNHFYLLSGTRTKTGAYLPVTLRPEVAARFGEFNDLATVAPQIAAQWHSELNGSRTPEMVTAGSKKKVWWRCGEGHVWQAVIYSRTGERKHGCPVCAGTVSRKRRDRYADIMAESNIGTGISAMRPTELSHKVIE